MQRVDSAGGYIAPLSLAEIVSAAYLVVSASVFVLFTVVPGTGDYLEPARENAVLLGVLVLAASLERRNRAGQAGRTGLAVAASATVARTVRDYFPLVLIGYSYIHVGYYATILFGAGFTLDPVVAAWDAVIFRVNPHTVLHQLLPGRFWAELMHLLYVLYYPLLFGGFFYVTRRRPSDRNRYAFVFIASFLSFVAVFSLFPVSGPMDYRVGLFPPTILFSRLVDFLFSFGIPVVGGAFPSSHVGQSVVVLLLLKPLSRGASSLVVFVIIGIGVSMGYASVHYSIDAVAGVPAGAVLYYFWDRVYSRYGKRWDQGVPGPGVPGPGVRPENVEVTKNHD